MKTISLKQVESAMFNLDSLRTKLMNKRDEAFYTDEVEYDRLEAKINEIETLMSKMNYRRISASNWERIQVLVNERKMQRYTACINSGMDERRAAYAFED